MICFIKFFKNYLFIFYFYLKNFTILTYKNFFIINKIIVYKKNFFIYLIIFYKNNINLTKIESRPSRKQPWEYIFFLDMEGHFEDEKIKIALEELKDKCLYFKILGSYPKMKV